jgi:hypothetical protein
MYGMAFALIISEINREGPCPMLIKNSVINVVKNIASDTIIE